MSFITSALRSIKELYSEINSATLTGAIDVVVVQQQDGSYKSSPFHVRFGKLGVLKAREKIVDIEINGEPVDIHMKLDDDGTAFFVECVDDSDDDFDDFPRHLATSPIPEQNQQPPDWQKENRIEETDEKKVEEEEAEKPRAEVGSEDVESRKGKLNRKKRKRRSFLKHSRTGSRSKDIKDPNSAASDIFEMDDVNNEGDDDDDDEDDDEDADENKKEENENELSTSSDQRHQSQPQIYAEINNSFLGSRIPRSISENENLEANLSNNSDPKGKENKENKDEHPRSRSMASNFQYFSDPEPDSSPLASRPHSPVLSDTEYEKEKKTQRSSEDGEGPSWKWGELPSPTTNTEEKSPKKAAESSSNADEEKTKKEAQSSGGKWSWSLFNKNSNKKDPEGVYLDDLKDDDDEMMAIYVGSVARGGGPASNDDAESGKGPSLPMSPNSVEGAIGGTRVFHDSSSTEDTFDYTPDVAISLCGGLDDEISPLMFEQSLISFDDFALRLDSKTDLFDDPNLVVRLDGRYYSWKEARASVMSWILYKRTLPENLLPKTKKTEDNRKSSSSSTTGITSWFGWGSRKDGTKTTITTEPPLPEESETTTQEQEEESSAKQSQQLPESEKKRFNSNSDSCDSSSSSSTANLEQQRRRKTKEQFRKTLRLSSDKVNCLDLRFGSNEAEFSVTTAYQGTTRCKCHIYLWKYTDKIVISDIDGTITKSDVLGHIFPIIGRDWAQSGVASLFTKIVSNGYHIIYLSARAIGQASITKDYLASIRQGDLCLPDGPLLLNPTSLVSAFHREVIVKKPEEFKISCLRDIQKLFDEDKNPFYAGYGNRINDAFAYRAVGIPISRIFTINYQGELKHELTQTFQTSYGNQSSIVDHIFPPRKQDEADSPTSRQNYSSFTYWRDPIPEVEFPITQPEENNKK